MTPGPSETLPKIRAEVREAAKALQQETTLGDESQSTSHTPSPPPELDASFGDAFNMNDFKIFDIPLQDGEDARKAVFDQLDTNEDREPDGKNKVVYERVG